jgi:protocatechuate 3,4-dioxygenase alpha subunit
MLHETASQTAGPYLHIGMAPHAAGIEIRVNEPWNVLAGAGAQGQRIRLEGRIYDGTGSLVRDAQIEIWQANAHGKYDHPEDRQDKPVDAAFKGFGRAVTDFESGLWWFDTVKPGTSTSPSLPAASTSTSTRGSISPTRPKRTRTTRCCGWSSRRQGARP